MNKKGLFARTAVGAVGGALLIGMAGVAVADEIESDQVGVNVAIAALPSAGALTMSVAAPSTSLTEVDSDDEAYRQFNGTLPTVTVTDDRTVVPETVFWYVVGQSSDFASATTTSTIGADRLGWTPALLPDSAANGEVAEGDGTVPSVDAETSPGNNVGLAGEELLALAFDSGEARPVGSWSANAALKLKTDVDVAPGAYASTITLTLWEDAY